MSAGVVIAQVAGAIASTPWQMILHASTLTKAVLVILVILSLYSWTVIFAKWWQFRGVGRSVRSFLAEFEKVHRLDQVGALARRSRTSPMTHLYTRAVEYLGHAPRASQSGAPATPAAAVGSASLSGSQVEALRLVLDAEISEERDRLSGFIPTLATIGSVSPLIGLLGTVLGVIDAFIGIATEGSGNIGAVAPGVAEALVATAAALAVAIPAYFGYNLFAARLQRLETQLDAFATEIIAMTVKEGHI